MRYRDLEYKRWREPQLAKVIPVTERSNTNKHEWKHSAEYSPKLLTLEIGRSYIPI
jgi:hypothetical protein